MSEELIPIVWHFCKSENEEKEIEPIFTKKSF